MWHSNSFKDELSDFILNRNLKISDQKDYWENISRAIELLFKFRDEFDGQGLLVEFLKVREQILQKIVDDKIEDFIDDINAILIRYYPMPDFWTSTVEDFKNHPNFKDIWYR